MRNASQVREFLDSALKYGDSVAIAVGPTPTTATENESTQAARTQDSLLRLISRAAREATDAHVGSRCGARYTEREGEGDAGAPGEGEEDGVRISVFEVTPWGKFTPALNALLGFAARDGADLVMFQVGRALSTLCGRVSAKSESECRSYSRFQVHEGMLPRMALSTAHLCSKSATGFWSRGWDGNQALYSTLAFVAVRLISTRGAV